MSSYCIQCYDVLYLPVSRFPHPSGRITRELLSQQLAHAALLDRILDHAIEFNQCQADAIHRQQGLQLSKGTCLKMSRS
jgi:hypothetical protein